MIAEGRRPIRHPLLEEIGVAHGFAVGTAEEATVVRPRQVHGAQVAVVRDGRAEPPEADAILSGGPGNPSHPVGIVTADCLPVLAASRSGRIVAAIHAGWRGLAAGVLEAGIAELAKRVGPREEITAVIGPHIGVCCYEVDAAVTGPLSNRFGRSLVAAATRATRPGHWRLDLARLAHSELVRAGVAEGRCAIVASACTCCDPSGFESYRRDGSGAGRMLHCITPRISPHITLRSNEKS